MTTKRDN